MTDYGDLMTRFRKAYGQADPDALAEVLTAGFEWHMHWFPTDEPAPTGKVLRGVDEMVAELHRRKQDWSELRYADLKERFAPELVTQTFRISGKDRGTPFEVDAVDLYDIVDGRIAVKSTYWKQPGPTENRAGATDS